MRISEASEVKDFSISKFHDEITLNKKINNLITYSIHTNVKRILSKRYSFLDENLLLI